MSDRERSERLEAWWSHQTEELKASLLPLHAWDRLPDAVALAPLTHALGLGPVGVEWVRSDDGYVFSVPPALADFIDSKRQN